MADGVAEEDEDLDEETMADAVAKLEELDTKYSDRLNKA